MANPFMIQQADFGKAFEDFSRGQTQKVERDRMLGLRAQSDERNQRIFDLEKSIISEKSVSDFIFIRPWLRSSKPAFLKLIKA